MRERDERERETRERGRGERHGKRGREGEWKR